MEEAGRRGFSPLVERAEVVSWPGFSSWGGTLSFAFSRSLLEFPHGERQSVCELRVSPVHYALGYLEMAFR